MYEAPNNNNMTKISAHNYSSIKSGNTPQEIVAFLEKGAIYRSFESVLSSFVPDAELQSQLVSGLEKITGEPHDSVSRKVRNWLGGKNRPQNREQMFQICFALNLTEDQADRFLTSAAECGIHYRSPLELVYAYALRTGCAYERAQKLYEAVKPFCQPSGGKNTPSEKYTNTIREEFSVVNDDASLMAFFEEFGQYLGNLHETAWHEFVQMYERLRQPSIDYVLDDSVKQEMQDRVLSADEIVNTYLRMYVPQEKKTANYTYLQKLLKKDWPNASSIQRMRSRKLDIDRKTMILLYLITEAFDLDADEDDLWNDEDVDTRMETRFTQMNLFLTRCGMNRLDLGSPFDCLVVYAMRTVEDESAGERFESALAQLFSADQQE